jgi:alkanesulfonate monooxygenase SsuD/methylene tetrahydromethanopterin reductase-like flavin-dependent oxidoreductase (luciferase family)
MLDEGVQIMRQAWTEGRATLNGKHYQVDGAIVRPTPLQDGGIPFWIAGGGEKVTLKIAAKYAAYTNFAGSIEEFDRKSEILRGHCDALGRDFGDITRSSNFNTIIAETEAEASDRLAAVKARVLPFVGEKRAEQIEADYRSSVAFGTREQIVEKLAARADHGLGYSIHYFPEAAYDRSGVELFEREVIPALS